MSERRMLPRASVAPEDLSGLKVLVVDDHLNTQRMIGDVLKAAGVGQVIGARDGFEARDALRLANPDIIFTDARMPGMDGLELTRLIRRAAVKPDPRVPDPQVPIVMVSGLRTEREVEIARRAGINEFVVKPFTPAALISRIQLVQTRPRPFIISEGYLGPDRRRRLELSYSGPLRRDGEAVEMVDTADRESTRDTIGVELEAMRRLVRARGVDRATLQMIQRVMQHTRHRARQVGDRMVERAANSLVAYADAMKAAERCDPAVVDIHFETIATLLATLRTEPQRAVVLVSDLEMLVRRKIQDRRVA
jgi:CheY-like chemotaxis protein